MKARDEAALTSEADEMYRSGSTETKNWLVCAGTLGGDDPRRLDGLREFSGVRCNRFGGGTALPHLDCVAAQSDPGFGRSRFFSGAALEFVETAVIYH